MIVSSMAQEAQQALKLIQGYSFELGWYSAESQVMEWLQSYRATWIRDAVIEALYQGRYKAVSVRQILALWGRRGHPVRHYNREFESIVGRQVGMQFPSLLLDVDEPQASVPGPGQPAQAAQSAGFADKTGLSTADSLDTVASEEAATVSAASQSAGSTGMSETSWARAVKPEASLENDRHGCSDGQPAPRPSRADQGVLSTLHQPIQPFQPDFPLRRQSTSRSRPKPVGFGNQ